MQKISILLSSEVHARSFFETNIDEQLINHFQLSFMCSKEIGNTYCEQLNNYHVDFFQLNPGFMKLGINLMNSGTWKFRRSSGSFQFRIKRWLFGDGLWPTSLSERLIFAAKFLKNSLKLLKIMLAAQIFSYSLKQYRAFSDNHCDVAKLISRSNAQLVVIWSSGQDPYAQSAVRASRKSGKKSVLVVDNWDNLSSKTLIHEQPDSLVCFGEQGVQFARKIHGLNDVNFAPIGSARFEVYRGLREDFPLKERNEILFAGSSLSFEDELILDTLAQFHHDYVQDNGLLIVYRPHPAIQGAKIDLLKLQEKYPFLEIDLDTVKNQSGNERFPKLAGARERLSRVRVAICMPTSFLLEALIAGSPVIIPAFNEETVRSSSKRLLTELEHLKGLSKTPGISVASSPEELASQIFQKMGSQTSPPISKEFQWYVSWTNVPFGDRLTTFLKTQV